MKVFVGWDSREDIAYQVAKQTIIEKSSIPVDIQPLKQKDLRKAGIYTRPIDTLASTEFTFTRFLIPELARSEDPILIIDPDVFAIKDPISILKISLLKIGLQHV